MTDLQEREDYRPLLTVKMRQGLRNKAGRKPRPSETCFQKTKAVLALPRATPSSRVCRARCGLGRRAWHPCLARWGRHEHRIPKAHSGIGDTGFFSPLRTAGEKRPRRVKTRRPPLLSDPRRHQTLRLHIAPAFRLAGGSKKLDESHSGFRER